MSRTLELGRSVLFSATAQLELWTTLRITISSEQHSIDLQKYSQAELVHFLRNQNAWLSRGSGLHMDMQLCVDGEPFPVHDIDILAQGIVHAPVCVELCIVTMSE